nr:DNA adenine methylase [Thiospirillum jenense]
MSLIVEDFIQESPAYLQSQLITYIGNKRALLPFIGKGVAIIKKRLAQERLRCLDLFAGTGVVSRYLKQHSSFLVANDLELYSEITNRCYLSNTVDVNFAELNDAIQFLHSAIEQHWQRGFIAELYAPECDEHIQPGERTFYTRRNAEYIDTARMQIACLPHHLQLYLLAPLIAQASVHANTSGVFKGFHKSKTGIGQFGGRGQDALTRIKKPIAIELPIFSRFACSHAVTRTDANVFFNASTFGEFDLVYLDPPYNQHPYGSNYFMLNLIATYERPHQMSAISGIPTNWNRSRYNQRREAEAALFEVIQNCPAKYVMVSYNSEGFIAHERFLDLMNCSGKLSVLETPYNTFRGSRNLNNRSIHVTEFLYLLEKT